MMEAWTDTVISLSDGLPRILAMTLILVIPEQWLPTMQKTDPTALFLFSMNDGILLHGKHSLSGLSSHSGFSLCHSNSYFVDSA
jgi:hypothetical protein